MLKAVILWALKVPVLLLLTVIAYIIAPVLACFITYAEESSVTGHPSLFPGKPRAFLQKWCRIWQTSDAPVDEWWYGNYEMDSWRHSFDQEDYDNSIILRWACRVAWLWRNPAYGFGEVFGWNGTGMKIVTSHGSDDDWYSGKSSCSYWTAVNDANQKTFYVQIRLYFYKNRCLDIMAGYKLFSDPTVKYVAMRFNPFRKYPK